MKRNSFNLPKNIRQMGGIDENFKIYVEDYVFTYLQQYSKEAKGDETIAVLIGENLRIDGKDVLFINGAISGKYTEVENGIVRFTKSSFKYIDEQLEKYFKGSSIVGWFYSQPGFSDYINDEFISYHKEVFKEDKNVFFLMDPSDNITIFHRFSKKENNFKASNGFIIYYEKNEPMCEYMLANRTIDPNVEEQIFKDKDEKLINLSRENKNAINAKLAKDNKKITNVFGSLSVALFLICFIMGAGLIQSDDRISELENRLAKLDESYRYVLSEVKEQGVQSVFADSNANTQTEKNTELTTTTQNLETTVTKERIEDTSTTESTTIDDEAIDFETYKVKDGDSLESISYKFYGSRSKIEEIKELNNLDDPNKIYAGKIIKLP